MKGAACLYDLVIRNGKIVDGSGNPWFYGDVGVKDGVIVHVGNIGGETEARRTVDLERRFAVSPGFIDGHCHSDLMILERPESEIKLRQGVTAEVVGNCGLAPAPLRRESAAQLKQYIEPVLGRLDSPWPWESVGEYLKAVSDVRPSSHVCTYVAHGSLRAAVMGFANRPADRNELDAMKELLGQSMDEGAIGLSLGLLYAPGRFADGRELAALSELVARRGGLLSVHLRGEGQNLLQAVDEMLALAESTGVPLQISHLKAAGRANWGKVTAALERIGNARSRGIDVACDVYPYTAGSTTLTTLLPPWAMEGGVAAALERLKDREQRKRIKEDLRRNHDDWDNLVVPSGWDQVVIASVRTEGNKPLEGRNVQQISEQLGVDPEDAVMDLLLQENGLVTIIFFHMDEREVEQVIAWDGSLIASDSLTCQTGKPHPRLYGCFPRLLGHCVRERRLLSLEQAVRKITSFPARRFNLHRRGLLVPGYAADITIFDPDTIIDCAVYQDPQQYPDGIRGVFVQGEATILNGRHLGTRSGSVLRFDGR
jgi:N-acyl-D-amino-acid deacylase